MSRQAIDSGGWFDCGKCVKFTESTYWNGNNHISRATGSQWDHEALYYTKGGNWVLNHWSQWQGVGESHRQIDQGEAVRWLISQEKFDEIDQLPKEVCMAVEAAMQDAEV